MGNYNHSIILIEKLDCKQIKFQNFSVLSKLLDHFRNLLIRVESVAFHEDLTYKNLLVKNGVITGVLDVDEICFGDSLFALARCKVGLHCRGFDHLYTDFIEKKLIKNHEKMILYKIYLAIGILVEISEFLAHKEKKGHVKTGCINILNAFFRDTIYSLCRISDKNRGGYNDLLSDVLLDKRGIKNLDDDFQTVSQYGRAVTMHRSTMIRA